MSAQRVIEGKIQLSAAAFMIVVAALLCAGCGQHEPRSFQDFMDDAIARDGALARCNEDREATLDDIECSNARRAAAAVAVAIERARSAELELQSERKLAALRDRTAIQQQAELRAAAQAKADAEAAYDAQWVDASAEQAQDFEIAASVDTNAGGDARSFGPRIGEAVLAADRRAFDYSVYARYEGHIPPRPTLELAAVTPPASDLHIARPELDLDEVVIPRPFRDAANGGSASQ